jgi:hypothetical protein
MSDSKWAKIVADFKRELAYVESSSQDVGRRYEILQREAESLKLEFLEHSPEKQRKAIARQRGLALLIRDRRKVGAGLAVTAGASILAGLITKDKDAALNAGLSGLYGVLQEFGETRWAVSLQNELTILPYDAIPAKGSWVTFESLIAAIRDLKTEALQGKRLGTLDNVIQRLQRSEMKLIHFALPNWNSRE